MIGETIAQRYRIVDSLGRGSRAAVYLSFKEDSREIVAVKVFGTPETGPEVLQRFSAALQGAAPRWQSIEEQHVAKVRDFGWDKASAAPFLVSEYIPGLSLAELLRRTAMLPVAVGLGIAQQVALGLAAAHAEDVVHGNVQPHQVFVTPQGRVKVTDFSLAALAEGCDWTLSELWPSDAALFYVTAEQIIGRDRAGDVYALGALLYHLLVGKEPFSDYDLVSLPQAIQSAGPALMTAARSGIPAEVDELVRRCMGRSMAADVGPISAAEAAEAIQSLENVQPATEDEIAEALHECFVATAAADRPQGQLSARLFIVQQDRHVPLSQGKVLIGRRDPKRQIHPDIDLSDLDVDRVLHRQHAELCREGSEWMIRACHRDGRLRVNERTVDYGESCPLHNGDKIKLSKLVDIIFELG